MGWLLSHGKLAHQIIATHNSTAILDNDQLTSLREFAAGCPMEEYMRKRGFWNESTGSADEHKVLAKGDLVSFAIAKGGFYDGDLDMLNDWFESDTMQEELQNMK